MPSASQVRRGQVSRGDEKLGVILRRVVQVRTRWLNRLALQQGLFESLSLIVGTAAIVLLAAFLLQPLKFLCVAIVLGVALMIGLVRAIRRSSRMRATIEGPRSSPISALA